MFGFTNVGWLIFRETHFDRLVHFFTLSPWAGTSEQWVTAAVMAGVAIACSMPMVLACWAHFAVLPRLQGTALQLPGQTALWAMSAAAIAIFVRSSAGDFIYFQF